MPVQYDFRFTELRTAYVYSCYLRVRTPGSYKPLGDLSCVCITPLHAVYNKKSYIQGDELFLQDVTYIYQTHLLNLPV